ncbi:MAG: nucleotidyltransferase domain-containing protein [Deltaproteobacteria bacterium]|nr:nucleotidyltransferase domain-containing protein [Deltaproteobacteria bacterium]
MQRPWSQCEAELDALAERCRALPGLSVLALHGSRATDEAHLDSDWNFAYLGDAMLDRTGLHLLLCDLLGTDAVDLADLDRSSAVLRWQVARSAVLVHEREADA